MLELMIVNTTTAWGRLSSSERYATNILICKVPSKLTWPPFFWGGNGAVQEEALREAWTWSKAFVKILFSIVGRAALRCLGKRA